MRCPKCGVEVSEASVYCHKCGARLEVAEGDSSPPADPAAHTRADEERPATTPAERIRNSTGRQEDDEPEGDLWQGGYAGKSMIGAWLLSGLITIGLFILALWFGWGATGWLVTLVLILLLWLYQVVTLARRKLGVKYRLTSRRFFHESGILRHVTDRIEAIDMDDVVFEQTLLERVVGVGTIKITSSDRSHPELTIHGIENVKEVAQLIDEARHKERMRRGLHIESI